MAPWRKDIDRRFIRQIARQEPFQVEPLIEYLSSGNAAIVDLVSRHVASKGPLVHPQPGQYRLAKKQCTDSRVPPFGLQFLLDVPTIHSRTAGSIVRKGRVFETLAPRGLAMVEGHQNCGACAAAHQFADSPLPDVDDNIKLILDAIPPYIRAIADPEVRDRENAKHQAYCARRILKLEDKKHVYTYPVFYTWDKTPNLEWLKDKRPSSVKPLQRLLEFLRGTRPTTVKLIRSLSDNASLMTEYALADGRNFGRQYSALTLLYDPFRLGRINDPRDAVGELGDGIFCVSADFRPFDPRSSPQREENISMTAMGSVLYAGYDRSNGHYGHVAGVGGHDGTHILGIMDVCSQTLVNTKKHILETYPLIAELTEQGKRILLMLYHPNTAQVEFVKE